MIEPTKPRPRRPGWFYRWMMGFMGLFDRWLHLSCRSFIQVVSESYKRPLRPGERIRQAMHRAMCGLCRLHENRMHQLLKLAQETGRTAVGEMDATLAAGATERIGKALAEAAGTRPPERDAPD